MDINRNDEQNNEVSGRKMPSSADANKKDHSSREPHYTEVENAHASGLGAMGRSDEKLKDKEKGKDSDSVVY